MRTFPQKPRDSTRSHSGDAAGGTSLMASPAVLPGDDAPDMLPMIALAAEPARPVETQVAHTSVCGVWISTIARLWEDPSKATCGGLCDTPCTFRRGMCTVTTEGFVPVDSCALFAKRLPAV